MSNQKGFVPILIVLLIALGVGGYLIYRYVGFCGRNCINESRVFPDPYSIKHNPKPNPVSSPIADGNQDQFVPGEIIVDIKPSVKFKEAEELIKSYVKYASARSLFISSKIIVKTWDNI